jgi:hypothetical protein
MLLLLLPIDAAAPASPSLPLALDPGQSVRSAIVTAVTVLIVLRIRFKNSKRINL